MKEQAKISITVPGNYRAHKELCQRLDRIVNEIATGIEIIYSNSAVEDGKLQIEYSRFPEGLFTEIIGAEKFECYCRQVDVVQSLRRLCGEGNTLAVNETLLSTLEDWFAEECVRIWYACVLPEDRQQAGTSLRRHFDTKPLLMVMARLYWDTPEELARRLGKIEAVPQKEKEIRTIGIFNYQMWNGGTDRVISILAPMYEQMGYRVVVITMEGPSLEDFPLTPSIPHVQITGTWETYSGNLGARFEQWDAFIKEYSVDLLIYHPWTLHLLVWDVLFLKLRGVSVLFQTHSVFSFLLAEGKSEFSQLTDRLPLGDGMVVTSRVDKLFWNCFHENVHYIPNPVAPALTRAKRSSGGEDKIVWIGRFSPEKRPLDAILIMECLVRQRPDAVLYMIGSGNEAVQEQCRQAVKEKRLERNVVFLGFQKDVYQYLEAASVHVVTSVYEGYSMVLLEAMAHGVPTVMYEMPYLDLCRTDYGVAAVEGSNYKQAAVEICRLLEDRSAWEKASQAAAKGFEEAVRYDYPRAWQKVISGEISPSASTEEEKVMLRAVVDHYLVGWRKTALYSRSGLPEDTAEVEAEAEVKRESAFAWLKRKFLGGVRCIRTHGVRYTLHRLMEKLRAKF